jgi:hypothetical protein
MMSPGIRAAFDTREEAEAAQARLIARGIDPAGIELVGHSAAKPTSGRGIFDQLTNYLAPGQVKTPGAFLLSAEVMPEQLEAATRALKHQGGEGDPISTAAAPALIEDKTYEFLETAEELVVEKQLFVREEVVLSKSAAEHVEEVFDTVRRTEVEIERIDPDQSGRNR